MFHRLRQKLSRLHGWAAGAAWFFIVVSLLQLAWVVQTKWPHPAGTTRLYHTVVGEVSYDALGLTYTGWPGLLLAILQSAAIGFAAAATLLPVQRWRRVGHLVLVAWATLWCFDLARLMMIDHQLDSVGQTLVMSALLTATIARAASGWSSAPKLPRWPFMKTAVPDPEKLACAVDAPSPEEKVQVKAADPRAERAREALHRTAERVRPYAAQGARTVGRGMSKAGDAVIGWSERISSPERVQKGVHALRRAVSASAGFASRQLAALAEVSRPPVVVPAPQQQTESTASQA